MLTIICLDETWREVKDLAVLLGDFGEILFYTEVPLIKEQLQASGEECVETIPGQSKVIIAGLDPVQREKAWNQAQAQGLEFATLIHPDNFLHSTVQIGKGCIIFRGIIGYPEGIVGDNCVMREYSSVSHNSVVGDHTVMMEKVTMGGWSVFGKRNLLKPNSVTKERIKLGDDVTAEFGSIILNDIQSGQTIAGNPARARRH